MRNKKQILLYALIAFTLVIFVAGVAWTMYKKGGASGRSESSQESVESEENASSEESTHSDSDGKYKDVTTILVMGLSEDVNTEMEHKQGDNGHLDSLALVVFDRTDNQVVMVPISADTMASVAVYYTDGSKAKQDETMQIGYQYAYGKDVESGVELTISSVEKLFQNRVSVDKYVLLPTEDVEKMEEDYQEKSSADAWTSWSSCSVLWDTIGQDSVIISNIDSLEIFKWRVRNLLVSNQNMKVQEIEGNLYDYVNLDEFHVDEDALQATIDDVWYH